MKVSFTLLAAAAVPGSALVIAALLIAALLISALPSSAQQKVLTPTFPGHLPTNTGVTSQGSGPGANPNNGPLQRGIYLTGRVQLDDGAPISMEVRIEKVCDGRRQPLGFADSKGHFSVTLKPDQGAATSQADYDSSSSRLGTTQGSSSSPALTGCDVQAAMSGYRSDSISLGSMRSLDDPNIGTIVLHRIGGTQGAGVVSASMLNAPKGAVKNFNRGLEDLHKEDPAGAEKNFRKAVVEYPQFATAWYELGMLATTHNPPESRQDFEKAIEADSKFMPPYVELAARLEVQQRWKDALELTDRALKVDTAGFPEIFYYSAVAHFNLGSLDEAEKRAREAVKADPTHRMSRTPLLLGYILAAKGNSTEAVDQMKTFLASNPTPRDAARAKSEIARLEEQAKAVQH